MSIVTKVLVLLGAAAMVLTPALASASGSALPVMLAGGAQDEDDDDGLGYLEIGGVVIGVLGLGLVLGGGGGARGAPKSN